MFRTGPVPPAGDFSKTLLKSVTDGSLDPYIGSVSKTQLLLCSLIERLHDAVYVVPRFARDTALGVEQQGAPPNPEEYARDIVEALRALKEVVKHLPDDLAPQEDMALLNTELEKLREENIADLARAREWEDKFARRGMVTD